MPADTSHRFQRDALWGLRLAPREATHARQIERRWRWPVLLALAGTVPAFYAELLDEPTPWVAKLAYLLAALVTAAALAHTAQHGGFGRHLRANPLDLALAAGLAVSTLAPESSQSTAALMFRALLACMTLVRMVWSLQHLIDRGYRFFHPGR